MDSNLFQSSPDGQLLLNYGSYRHGLYQFGFDAESMKVQGDPVPTAFNASNVAFEAAFGLSGRSLKRNGECRDVL